MSELTLLCPLADLPESGSKGFELELGAIFVIRQQDQIQVYRNSCPHTGVRLEWLPDKFLDLEQRYIQCSTHGALFQPEDGLCVAGPCSGQSLQAVEFELRDGALWVRV